MRIGRAIKVFLAVAVVCGMSVGMATKTDPDLAGSGSLCGSRVTGSQVSASRVVTSQGSRCTIEITGHG